MSQSTNTGESLPGQADAPFRPAKSKKRGLIWIVFMLLVAGVVSYAAWRASQTATAAQRQQAGGGGGGGRARRAGLGPTPVVVTKAARSSIPVYLNGLGNVTAYYTVTIKSRVDGQLMKVDFNEGDFVKAGDVLVEIDPRPFQVQLDVAEAALAHPR